MISLENIKIDTKPIEMNFMKKTEKLHNDITLIVISLIK